MSGIAIAYCDTHSLCLVFCTGFGTVLSGTTDIAYAASGTDSAYAATRCKGNTTSSSRRYPL
eukprot:2670936-Rhodomonas_salina.3